MTAPSVIETLTGIKPESLQEKSQRRQVEKWSQAVRFVWQVMILSAWFIFIAAGIWLAFGHPTLGLAVTALVATIILGSIASNNTWKKR